MFAVFGAPQGQTHGRPPSTLLHKQSELEVPLHPHVSVSLFSFCSLHSLGGDYANAVVAYTASPLLLCPPISFHPGDREHTLLVQSQHLGNMSYMKKDEDADQVMIKLDRTSVFQDGTWSAMGLPPPPLAMRLTTTTHCTIVLTGYFA